MNNPIHQLSRYLIKQITCVIIQLRAVSQGMLKQPSTSTRYHHSQEVSQEVGLKT